MPSSERAPSIKGIALQLAVDAVNQLLEEGRLSREELELRLAPEDLQMLEQKVLAGMWYPVASVGRLLEISTERVRARGGVQALVDLGVRHAGQLFGSELYRTFIATAESRGAGAGPILVRLAPLLFNFGRWTYHEGPRNGFRVQVEGAGELPEILRFLAQGFIRYLAERVTGDPVRVTSARPDPERLVYTGLRSPRT